MKEIKIERGIPIPLRNSERESVYPFAKMKIGDSFKVARDKAQSVRASANSFGIKHKRKFVVRKIERGYRCWRVK